MSKFCKVSLKAHKKDLLAHAKSKKHEKAVSSDKLAKSCKPLTEVFKATLQKEQKIAELKITAFIAEHSAFRTVDHLIGVLPQLDPSSTIIGKLKLKRTKCSMLIKNVMGPCMLADLIEEIGEFPFSLIIDETTDLSKHKMLCIMIRFFSLKEKNIVTTFYRLLKLSQCDAKSVHDAIKIQLAADDLKIENMVGIGVDGASVMVDQYNSVATLFKKDLGDLVVVKCVCHSLHLCAEKAAETLPRQLEFLVREAHNWFSYSPKRMEKYKDLYETINGTGNPNKIPVLSGTRWLARYRAINVILQQWDELYLLFSIARSEDQCYMAEQLYDIMRRPSFKAFLTFLKNELKQTIELNILLQSDNVEPTKLLEDLFLLYKSLLKKLVLPCQLEKIDDDSIVDFNFRAHLMHTSAMYFGYDFHRLCDKLEEKDFMDVKERCKKFLCTLAEEIQKRLPNNLSTLKMMAHLHPKVATSKLKPTLKNIVTNHVRPQIWGNINDIESEWDNLSTKKWCHVNDFMTRCITIVMLPVGNVLEISPNLRLLCYHCRFQMQVWNARFPLMDFLKIN